MNGAGEATRTLLEDSVPLLDSQVRTADAIRIWARGLAGVTDQLVADDPRVRTLLDTGPVFAQEVSGLLDSVQPTLGFAHYDPRPGSYMGSDGKLYQQTDLVAGSRETWQEMFPH